MNPNKIKALLKRELTDIFRDKKTLCMMVLLPLLLYPLMIVGMTLLFSAITQSQEETTYQVAFADLGQEREQTLTDLLEKDADTFSYQISVEPFDENDKTIEQALKDGDYDAVLSYEESQKDPYRIYYLEAKDDSGIAAAALKELLEDYNKQLQKQKVQQLGLDADEILNPVRYEEVNYSSTEQTMGNMLGDIVPMLVIISIMMGAIYPAIDVTAGEKERGTLETLLTLPVTNFELIMSKFLAVSVIACVSAILNIVSMGAAFGFMFSYMMEGMGAVTINYATFLPAILFTLLVMVFFALFVTAVSLCICIFAKSFKEANNYITPMMLVFMFGSMVTMVPNIELTEVTAAIPIVNISLMIVQLFSFSYNYALFGIVLLSNIVYSLLAVLILGKIYNSEAVLFSEGMSSLKLFTPRSEMRKGQIPGIGDVVVLICVELLLIFYVGTAAQLKMGFYGTVVVQLLILLFPLLYLWYLKADFKKVLSLQMPKVLHILAALFVWIGGFSLMCMLAVFLTKIFPESTQSMADTMAEYVRQPFWVLVLVMAVMPAVGEELMFRGFIFGTLKRRWRVLPAMLVTAAIFGIYHMSLSKFFTTALLGFMLVYVVEKTGSIFCSMLMHFCNNLVAVVVMKYSEQASRAVPILTKSSYALSDYLLLVGVACIGLGLGWLLLKKTGIKKQ